MLKDIAGIKLKGGNFVTTTDVMVLNPYENGTNEKKVKCTLLYGKNGAGKSTLAKAFKKAKGDEQNTINSAYFLDKDCNILNLSEEDKSRIFVFDEEFVDKNIKLRESGLNTIIMLGQQVEIEEQLNDARKKLDDISDELQNQKEVVIKYEDSENELSPKYFLKNLKWALQGDDCWSGRDKIIKGHRQNTNVYDNTYQQFIGLSTDKTRDQLIIEFNDILKELRKAQQGDERIIETVPSLTIDYDEESINQLLRVKIERPELSEREYYLLELVQSGKTPQLNKMIEIFSDVSINPCPTCMQPVSKQYKEDLVGSIQKVLSKIVEEHQEILANYIIQEISIDLKPFSKLTKGIDLCETCVNQIIEAIKKNNLIIQSKIDDPYTPCNQPLENVSELLSQLKSLLDDLETERIEYNNKISETQPLIDQLTEINNLIAYLDIRDYYIHYLAANAQLGKEREKLSKKQEEYGIAKSIVDELEVKQKNVEVAISIINNNLRYIFFSNDRFIIDYQNDNYVLLSNGQMVKPSNISQGERNIIGLCYFFASILQGQEESKAYNKEYLLIIDDPVSSFDIENKTGIMSFLRFQLGKFLSGNEFTRAVVMTHDLLTFFDSEKIFKELVEISNKTFGGEKRQYRLYEIRQKELIKFSYGGRQEYTELIKIVYSFAKGDAEEYDMFIGNIMRQMLEAFSTFQYKKGIEKVSTDQNVLDCLPEDVYKEYFENLMYRLILNNGSHRLEQTQAMSDLNFFTVISKEEKQRTAKEILCFIYLLNPRHLLSHLEGCNGVETNLSSWCEDIKNIIEKRDSI